MYVALDFTRIDTKFVICLDIRVNGGYALVHPIWDQIQPSLPLMSIEKVAATELWAMIQLGLPVILAIVTFFSFSSSLFSFFSMPFPLYFVHFPRWVFISINSNNFNSFNTLNIQSYWYEINFLNQKWVETVLFSSYHRSEH